MAGQAATAPPIAHAMGGALGSAFALLLFYPLERARIELQAQASVPSRGEDIITGIADSNKEFLTSVDVQMHNGSSSSAAEDECIPSLLDEDFKQGGCKISVTGSETSSWAELAELKQKSHERVDSQSCDDAIPQNSSSRSATYLHPPSPKKKRVKGLMDCLHELRERGELYQGAGPVVATLATSQFVFFYLHALVKGLLLASSYATIKSRKSSAIQSLITSCLAGIGNVMLTNPLWVVNMAIITGQTGSNSLLKELFNMAQQRGLPYLWNGTSASLLLVSNPIIQFFCYEQMKNRCLLSHLRRGRKLQTLSPIEAFALGATAKGIATIATYPLQLAQTILRLNRDHQVSYNGTIDCLLQLYQQGGIDSIFTGMRAKLLQTVLTAAFTFLTYEQILTVVQTALLKSSVSR